MKMKMFYINPQPFVERNRLGELRQINDKLSSYPETVYYETLVLLNVKDGFGRSISRKIQIILFPEIYIEEVNRMDIAVDIIEYPDTILSDLKDIPVTTHDLKYGVIGGNNTVVQIIDDYYSLKSLMENRDIEGKGNIVYFKNIDTYMTYSAYIDMVHNLLMIYNIENDTGLDSNRLKDINILEIERNMYKPHTLEDLLREFYKDVYPDTIDFLLKLNGNTIAKYVPSKKVIDFGPKISDALDDILFENGFRFNPGTKEMDIEHLKDMIEHMETNTSDDELLKPTLARLQRGIKLSTPNGRGILTLTYNENNNEFRKLVDFTVGRVSEELSNLGEGYFKYSSPVEMVYETLVGLFENSVQLDELTEEDKDQLKRIIHEGLVLVNIIDRDSKLVSKLVDVMLPQYLLDLDTSNNKFSAKQKGQELLDSLDETQFKSNQNIQSF